MNVILSVRGFDFLVHPAYPPDSDKSTRLASASSAVGDYPDAMDRPGTSFLWIGDNHHLDREEVAAFVQHLQAWLATGRLAIADPPAGD